MPRVIFRTAATLDGFLADPEDSLDWLFAVPGSETGTAEFDAFLDGIGVLVQGSTTYTWVLEHEDLLAHPEQWPDYYGRRPTWVFTSRDVPAVDGADIRMVSGAVADHWDAIARSAGGRDVWLVGGGDLVGQFADAGRLDEIVVDIAPVTLGEGRPLLPRRLESDRLALRDVRRNGPFAQLVFDVRS